MNLSRALMPKQELVRKLIAEAIGTYFLVFAGTGAIVVNDVHGGVTHVGIALTFGLVVMALIYAFGEVSGAHFNPAVTLGFWAARRFPAIRVAPYILVQLLAACLASVTLRLLFPAHESLGATLPAGGWGQAFVLEVILTLILMIVILQVSAGSRETGLMAGAAIGATVGLEAMFAGPVCGASMNPARSLGPALVSGQLGSLWIYCLATPLGAWLAVGLHKLLREPVPEVLSESTP